MRWRALLLSLAMLTSAVAFHEHTFAVWELREELQIRFMNLWELLDQLKYVTAEQRVIVYQEIQHIRSEIQHIVDQLIQHDRSQHP